MSLKSRIALELAKARKSKKMKSETGIIEPGEQSETKFPTMEPDMALPNQLESLGPDESDARDIVDSGGALKPELDAETAKDHDAPEMDQELLEILRRKKARYIK